MTSSVDALIAESQSFISNETNINDASEASTSAVPKNLHSFRSFFEDLRLQDMSLQRSPKRKMVKVMLGIFTKIGSQRHKWIRQILRDTWMNHPDVCTIDKITPECTIHVAFVGCQGPSMHIDQYRTLDENNNQVLKHEPDVLLLMVRENMNKGKTFFWLKYAARRFRWADFVGKIDDDVFLHVNTAIDALPVIADFGKGFNPSPMMFNFLDNLNVVNGPCEAYIGEPWTCSGNKCPPPSCGPPIGRNFSKYAAPADMDCWSYMQGGFYALSRWMADEITQDGGFFQKNKEGDEDMVTGRAVHEYAKQTGKCVRIWNQDDIANSRLFYHMRGKGMGHPGGMGHMWDWYYGFY